MKTVNVSFKNINLLNQKRMGNGIQIYNISKGRYFYYDDDD